MTSGTVGSGVIIVNVQEVNGSTKASSINVEPVGKETKVHQTPLHNSDVANVGILDNGGPMSNLERNQPPTLNKIEPNSGDDIIADNAV